MFGKEKTDKIKTQERTNSSPNRLDRVAEIEQPVRGMASSGEHQEISRRTILKGGGALAGSGDELPALGRPFDLPAVALHDGEFLRQTAEGRFGSELLDAVGTTLENAGGVIAAWPLGGVAKVRVDGGFGGEGVAAVRAIPGEIHSRFSQKRQALRAAARCPHRQVLLLQNFLGSAPILAIHFAPVLEIAGEKCAKRARFDSEELFIERPEPDLLGLQFGRA